MKKTLLSLLILCSALLTVSAQSAKTHPPKKNTNGNTPSEKHLSWPGKAAVPPAENPFEGLPEREPKPLPHFSPVQNGSGAVRIVRDETGWPILFNGSNKASTIAENKAPGAQALEYFAALAPTGIQNPPLEFRASQTSTDEQGNLHVRLEQVFQGVPVFGGEVVAHTQKGAFNMANGRYFPTPQLASVTPALVADQAVEVVKKHIGPEKINTDWSKTALQLIGNKPQFETTLVVYHPQDNFKSERLAWLITARPNFLSRLVYFVDAQNGEILHFFDHTCRIAGHHEACSKDAAQTENHTAEVPPAAFNPETPVEVLVNGAVTATGQDYSGQTRTFGAWMDGSTIYLEDASKSMFKPAQSKMPDEPVGAIVTLNGLNTSPETNAFNYDFVTSNSTAFNNASNNVHKEAVSAHFNAIQSYDYFLSTFSRNSIDGVGGNIISFINVAESDGSSMENAFWNGEAMFYGRGGSAFRELARGLDVGGHEMTHGVIEKTANLVYMNESGALNESFADIFGVMIDRDDWKIGEDVMRTTANPSGCLRDMQNPNNGASSSSPWWQPKDMNEKYTGSQDNGGVHINSGIVNRAFYLFASNAAVGKDKAERVYYKALRDYLVKSSRFIDCRIAVEKAATDLYGATVANAASVAFTTVGIGSGGGTQTGGNYLGQLNTNPGQDLVLCVSSDYQNLDLANGTGLVLGTLDKDGVLSRPSVRDNGTEFVYVDKSYRIIGGSLQYQGGNITPSLFVIDDQNEWRNAALSKDGRYLAALDRVEDKLIYVFDLASPTFASRAFKLYNPTYSQQPTNTDEVRYADVLEFDYSGNYIVYDAFNSVANTFGDTISYWDIGFLKFRENGQFAPANTASISKLFTGIPENSSLGDPSFSKNSPFILAFDYYDGGQDQFDIYGINTETGDFDVIVSNNGDYSWPSYTRLDNGIIYEGPDNAGDYNLYRRGVDASKIKGSGNETQFVADHVWGVWFANGTRSLLVDAQEPSAAALELSVSPNPAGASTRVAFTAPASGAVQLSLADLLGKTLSTRQANMVEGRNTFDLDLQSVPVGTYVVRILAGGINVAIKVVKQ